MGLGIAIFYIRFLFYSLIFLVIVFPFLLPQAFTQSEISDDMIPPKIRIWLDKLANWLENDLISEQEFSNVIDYLSKNEIIQINSNKLTNLEPTLKNKSILQSVKFTSHRWNENAPIVFQGKLMDNFGNRISNATIIIESDGPCPSDKIIGRGITDKHGRYKILTHASIWDEEDNLITVLAKFPGNEKFSPSVSDPQKIVVYPVKGEKCVG